MNRQISTFKFHFLNVLKSFIYLVFITGFILGCNDDPYQIGLNLLPDEDNIEVQDTALSIEAYTIGPEKLLNSDSTLLSIGYFNDSVFGSTQADFLVQLTPYDSVDVGSDPVVDSVILNIHYSGYVGDSFYIPQLKIFELTQEIDTIRSYSDFDPTGKFKSENLVDKLTFRPDSTFWLKTYLSKDFGLQLLDIQKLIEKQTFKNGTFDSVFQSHFKGLYFTTEFTSSDKCIMYVNSLSITIKFHSDSEDSTAHFFYYPNLKRYVKIYKHNYSNNPIISPPDFSIQDTCIYLQSLGGTQGIIKIPNLEQLRQTLGIGNVSVNRAELFIPVLSDSLELSEYAPPEQLGMRIVGNDIEYIPDDILYGGGYYSSSVFSHMNGMFNSALWGYKFILTGFFQEYFQGNINFDQFKIFSGTLDEKIGHTNFEPLLFNRVILSSGSNTNRKITLKIAYTKLAN